MTDELLKGQWIAQIGEQPLNLAMRLTFKGGQVFESSMPVGTYMLTDDQLVAIVGEHCQLEFSREANQVGGHNGTLRTSLPGEEDFSEYATLFPDRAN